MGTLEYTTIIPLVVDLNAARIVAPEGMWTVGSSKPFAVEVHLENGAGQQIPGLSPTAASSAPEVLEEVDGRWACRTSGDAVIEFQYDDLYRSLLVQCRLVDDVDFILGSAVLRKGEAWQPFRVVAVDAQDARLDDVPLRHSYRRPRVTRYEPDRGLLAEGVGDTWIEFAAFQPPILSERTWTQYVGVVDKRFDREVTVVQGEAESFELNRGLYVIGESCPMCARKDDVELNVEASSCLPLGAGDHDWILCKIEHTDSIQLTGRGRWWWRRPHTSRVVVWEVPHSVVHCVTSQPFCLRDHKGLVEELEYLDPEICAWLDGMTKGIGL